MAENETCIIQCKKCGILTRHEWVQWESRPTLLLLFTSRIKAIEGWECTKCGHRQAVSTRYELYTK
jgi:Zn ribbon nucleic-acid-binding protein